MNNNIKPEQTEAMIKALDSGRIACDDKHLVPRWGRERKCDQVFFDVLSFAGRVVATQAKRIRELERES